MKQIGDDVWQQQIAGTDLEVNFNLSANDLVVRVNKGGTQIFRVVLRSAANEMTVQQLQRYNPLSPDLQFKTGNMEEAVKRMLRDAGLAP